MAAETKRQRFERRLAALKSERVNWEPTWRDLSEYFQPWRGRFVASDVNQGDRRNNKIVDNTGTLALRTLASGMMAGITSPARPWFKLEVPDPDLMESANVKRWLFDVEHRMRTHLARSNIYNTLHQTYTELGLFATGGMVIVEDDDDIFRGVPLTAGSFYIATNAAGMVDTVYREFKMTVRQMVDRFGYKNCSEQVQGMYDSGTLEQWVDVVHLVEPNDERDPDKRDNRNMKFRSVHYEPGSSGSELLSESGFEEFAGMFPRWDVLGEDVYGYGPGYEALGDCKALQTDQRMKGKAVAKMVDPPMNVPSTMKSKGRYSLLPGAVNYVDVANNGNAKAEPAHNVNLPLNYVLEAIQDNQQRIKRAFFEDLFLMLANDNRSNITAREIAERHEEKLLMLGPVLERLQSELLNPLIDRVFGILFRNGYLPDPPEELQGVELRVEYVSIMAQAQKLVGTGAIERLASFAGNLAGADPTVLDKIDTAQMIDEYGQAVSAPPRVIRSDEQVEEIRQQRAAREQAAQMAQSGQQAAQGAKLLSEADTGGDNALTRMLQQMGAA